MARTHETEQDLDIVTGLPRDIQIRTNKRYGVYYVRVEEIVPYILADRNRMEILENTLKSKDNTLKQANASLVSLNEVLTEIKDKHVQEFNHLETHYKKTTRGLFVCVVIACVLNIAVGVYNLHNLGVF